MQELPSCKAIANGLHVQQLNCFTRKYRMAVRIMKLTAIILLSACLQLSARGLSQTITLNLKDAPIQKVFKEIKRQTGYTFFVDIQWLDKAKKVTIEAKNLPLNQVLDLCFRDQPFTYSISGKTITIGPKKIEKQEKSSALQNPPIDIKGRIVDAKGDPISNATITVKGTLKSTISNNNGEFTLAGVEENAVLVITHVQYEMESIVLKGNTNINAVLQIKISSLDELQVIAYGTTTKRFNTGNVVSVKSSEIENQPTNNPLLALEGRVPGLVVTPTTGLPGSGVTVRIQGVNSITKGNDPLYIIDGVPYPSQLLPTISGVLGTSGGVNLNGVAGGNGNPLSFINPADIESIEVLKDADATSIYGSRAANGAILITTKKGKAGETRVSANYQTGFGMVAKKLNLLNSDQYLKMRHEAIANDGLTVDPNYDFDINGFWDTTRTTDWQKELIGRKSHYNDAQLSVSGGNANTQFLVGGAYHTETTVFPGDFGDKKASVHFNLNNYSVNRKFNLQLSTIYLNDNNRLSSTDLTGAALLTAPTAPNLYNSDGSLNWMPLPSGSSTWTNPLAALNTTYKVKTNNLLANAVMGYKIFDWLEVKSNFGYSELRNDEINATPLIKFAPEQRPTSNRFANYANAKITSTIIEPQLNVKRKLFRGNLDFLIGGTFTRTNSQRVQFQGSGFNSDLVLDDIKSAATVTVASSVATNYKYNALFGRINYNLMDKYIIDLTARRDGSSRFGPENLFHNFGSVGAAWIFSNESFFKPLQSIVSFGKLRGSYGTTGNDQIGDYQFMNLYVPPTGVGVAYQGATGLLPRGLTNPFLQWEETKKFQAGIDLGFLKDRIILNANYFDNKSSNQLLDYALPIITGFYSQTRNFPATVRNYGWELSLNSTNLKLKNFEWSMNVNLTIPKNKLTAFPNLASSSYANSLVIGQPITLLKEYSFAGVDPTTGVYQFYDSSGNITGSPNPLKDVTVLINTSPTLYGGWQNNFRYKDFSLSVLLQFVQQKAQNYRFGNAPGSAFLNQPAWVLNRWTKDNTDNAVQRFNSDYTYILQYINATNSNGAYQDASYCRFKNVSLSWELPKKFQQTLHVKDFQVYCNATNLFTITSYKGLDPETRSTSRLPPLRVVTFGGRITL